MGHICIIRHLFINLYNKNQENLAWNIGVMEYWGNGRCYHPSIFQDSNTPILQMGRQLLI